MKGHRVWAATLYAPYDYNRLMGDLSGLLPDTARTPGEVAQAIHDSLRRPAMRPWVDPSLKVITFTVGGQVAAVGPLAIYEPKEDDGPAADR